RRTRGRQPMAFEEKPTVVAGGASRPRCTAGLVATLVQETLRAEFDQFLGAAPYERTPARRGRRNGSYPRTLETRVGALTLAIPRDCLSRPGPRKDTEICSC